MQLPSYLSDKPDHTILVSPPMHTRAQSLPFSKLLWENFERLCKALVETDSDVKSCKLYGGSGHRQHGIDLIAFAKDLKDKRPRVYQCKRVEQYRAAQIKGAVKKFTDNIPTLRSKWKTIPSRFVLCCRCSLRSPDCQDEIVRQRNRLAKIGVSFETWDEEELSKQLKDQHRIVDDFFQREWVRAFNGQEAAMALSQMVAIAPAHTSTSDGPIAMLLLGKELENQTLTTALDKELSGKCKAIREDFKKGAQQKALQALQAYLDRFDTDLHIVSRTVQAKFWYTAGVLQWKLPKTRPHAKVCLDKAQKLDPSLDVRDLSARILFADNKSSEALEVLEPLNTQQVSTLKLALFLDLRRLDEFDVLWQAESFERDDAAFELLAYRQRLDRNFEEALQSIQVSLEQSPRIPSHLLAAAHIYFWHAIPDHLDKAPRSILPAWIHPLFYAPTATQAHLLERAANYYTQALAIASEVGPTEATQMREIEEFILLCRAYHPLQRVQAQELAALLLSEDPTVFTALFYCLEWDVTFDLDRSIAKLEAKRSEQAATPNDVMTLCQLYDRKGDHDHAIQIMETEKTRFFSAREEDLWVELMSGLYINGGQASKARSLREEAAQDLTVALRLRALEHDIAGNHSATEQAALEAWTNSQSPIDLINLCGFYRKTEQWAKLASTAEQLVSFSSDPRSLWYRVESLYQIHLYQPCLDVINEHRSVWLEPSLLDNLGRIEIECLTKLNRLDHAVVHLEAIRRERPSTEIVQRLADVYFRLGRRDHAVRTLREAAAQPSADTHLLIGTSQLLVHENPEEAFQLAQRATEIAPTDPSVWIFSIETGFLTGHDLEAGQRVQEFRERFPTSTALQAVSFQDAMQRMAAQQQAQVERWELYRRGEAPVHLLMDVDHHPLGFDWYMRFETNCKAATWNKKLPIYARHGSRGCDSSALLLETKDILIDYTSLLLCHTLGLLPIMEQAFQRIILAPSTFSLIQMESLNAARFQVSRQTISQAVKTVLDSGEMRILTDAPHDEALRAFEVDHLGRTDALLFYCAKQQKGLVLVQHLKKESIGQLQLNEELSRARVSPYEVLTAMCEVGAISTQELASLSVACNGQPCREDRVQLLKKKPFLVLDIGTAEFFARHEWLEGLTRAFKIGIPKHETDHTANTLEEFRLRQEASHWLNDLNRYLSERLNQRYFFPSTTLPDLRTGDRGQCARLLEELVSTTRIEPYPLWSDDRMVNRHRHVEEQPIVTIDAVLALVKKKGLFSAEQYYDYLIKLMQLNVLYLPIPSDLVVLYLRSAGISAEGALLETYELKVIRRYAAYVFSNGTALHPLPMEQGKPSEAATYFYAFREACREAVIDLWTDEALTKQHKDFASKWIVERLWKGIEDVAHLETHPLDFEDMVAISQSFLIGFGLVMTFADVKRRGENAASYLGWLYETHLESHWQSNPSLKHLVLKKIRQVIIGMIEKETGDRKKITLALLAHVLATTSKELATLILSDDKLKSLFQDQLKQTVMVTEDLKVPTEEWEQWGFNAISAGAGIRQQVVLGDRTLTVLWHEPSLFTAGLGLVQSSPDGSVSTVVQNDPFLRLRHPSRAIRDQALHGLTPYLEISHDAIKRLSQHAASDGDRQLLATEVEQQAEKSWTFFWERLKQLVIAQIGIHESMAFPLQPELFEKWLNLPSATYHDQASFAEAYTWAIEENIQAEGVGKTVAKVFGLPVGGCYESNTALGKLFRSESDENDQIVENILARARTSWNPVVLLNSLEILLRFAPPKPTVQNAITHILTKLVPPADNPEIHRIASSYKLYASALRFAWYRMESMESYASMPVLQRILLAYAYATGVTNLADDLRDQENYDMDRESLAKWMDSRISRSGTGVFEDLFEEHLEVSHPMTMGPFRMTVSATLQILAAQKESLATFGDELLRLVIGTAKSIVQAASEGGWEIYRPFVTTRNWFQVPWGRNAIASLKELLEGPFSDRLSRLGPAESEVVASVQSFDARALLQVVLDQITSSGAWNAGDLLLVYLALSEPINAEQTERIRGAMQRLDLSQFREEQDFQLACAVIARCGRSTKDSALHLEGLDKLMDAWNTKASTFAHYMAIIDAALKLCLGMGGVESFYSWWERTINATQREVPSEVQGLAAGLTWTAPLGCQSTLSSIRAKLLLL